MKAVIPEVPEHVLAERRRTGADRWDEMWEGVLHMAAAPNRRHMRFQVQLHNWLETHWGQPGATASIWRSTWHPSAAGRTTTEYPISYF